MKELTFKETLDMFNQCTKEYFDMLFMRIVDNSSSKFSEAFTNNKCKYCNKPWTIVEEYPGSSGWVQALWCKDCDKYAILNIGDKMGGGFDYTYYLDKDEVNDISPVFNKSKLFTTLSNVKKLTDN